MATIIIANHRRIATAQGREGKQTPKIGVIWALRGG
jgi:hypothetical protein